MKTRIFCILALLAISSSTSLAQQPPELTCTDLNFPINDQGSSEIMTLTYSPADLTGLCTSATNDTLTLNSPTSDIEITIAPSSTQTIQYTVSDEHGHTATANIIFTR